MKVNFQGENLNIKNELQSKNEFKCKWKTYIIQIEKWTSNKFWDYSVYFEETDYIFKNSLPLNQYSIQQVLQICFDLIDEKTKEN